MTDRVFDCIRPPMQSSPSQRPDGKPAPAAKGFSVAVLSAVILVPLVGAGGSHSFVVAALSAISALILLRVVGTRVRWGWLGLLLSAAALVIPSAQLAPIGPAVYVAAPLCLLLWLINRTSGRRDRTRPVLGSRERDAQIVMGMSGERHVGQVLARELPADFVLVNGLKLPRGAGDIDHLVVGPTGVFVLES